MVETMSRQTSDMPEVPERPGNRKRRRDRPWSLYVTYSLTRNLSGLSSRYRHGRYETRDQAEAVAAKIRRECVTMSFEPYIEIVKEG